MPQAYVLEYEHGYVPPEAWDRGINALYTSYYASQYYSDYKNGGDDKSSYLNLNSGLNLRAGSCIQMPIIRKATKTAVNGRVTRYIWNVEFHKFSARFAQVKCILVLMFFDSVRFRGVRLWRDMQMLPNSKQNFTPVVRGVAQSNALVTIEQNGFVVYQKEVPPGPFAIDDLQLSNGGADLEVIVKEADGSMSYYRVPYSSVPNMLQPGVSKYEFSAGRSHIEGASNQSDFIQWKLSAWFQQFADRLWRHAVI